MTCWDYQMISCNLPSIFLSISEEQGKAKVAAIRKGLRYVMERQLSSKWIMGWIGWTLKVLNRNEFKVVVGVFLFVPAYFFA